MCSPAPKAVLAAFDLCLKAQDGFSLPSSCLSDIDSLLHAIAREIDKDTHAYRNLLTARYLCEDWQRLIDHQIDAFKQAVDELRPLMNQLARAELQKEVAHV